MKLYMHPAACATTPGAGFDLEDTIAFGDRAIILWRYRWREGQGPESSARGVNLMRVRDGRIVEAKGYVKASWSKMSQLESSCLLNLALADSSSAKRRRLTSHPSPPLKRG